MYKLIHIHSESKFLMSIDKYQHDLFENSMLIIGHKNHSNSKYHDIAVFFKREEENIDKIVKYISKFDLVIFEELTPFNKKILLKLPKKIKVSWRFFGYELYSKRLDLMLSDHSLKVLDSGLKYKSKKSLKKYFEFIKYKYSFIYHFFKYVKRIDNIQVTSKEEYNFIKKHWLFLPKMLLIPIVRNVKYEKYEKKDFIILGNSKNIFNNHLDILDIIKNCGNVDGYKVKMFLSYGVDNEYYQEVYRKATEISKVEVITDFLSREEFNQIYKDAAALVLNCYRQMALGNILTAIEHNCKIYLNEKNPLKQWLHNAGFYVFSIADFDKDYKFNNLKLSENHSKNNIFKLNELKELNNFTHFNNQLIKLFKEENN